jgi:hypothetical protein
MMITIANNVGPNYTSGFSTSQEVGQAALSDFCGLGVAARSHQLNSHPLPKQSTAPTIYANWHHQHGGDLGTFSYKYITESKCFQVVPVWEKLKILRLERVGVYMDIVDIQGR